MKGGVSIEYALLLIALVGTFLLILEFYVDRFPFLHEDFKRMIGTRIELLKLKSAGSFASLWDEANITYVVVLPKEVNAKVEELLADVNVWESYSICGDVCTIVVPGSPFTQERELRGIALLTVRSKEGEVWVE